MEKVRSVLLYIGAFELPDKNAAAHRVIGNSKVLEKIGYEVYLAGFATNINTQEIQQYKSTTIKYFDVKKPSTILDWIIFVLSLSSILKKVEKKVDTIVAYDFPSIGLIFLYIISKLKRIRLVGDCTEWYDIENNNIIGLIKKLDVAFRMQILNKYLSGLIVISDYLYEYYQKYNCNVINIPPLVDLSDQIWSLEPENNSCIVITYAGIPFSLNDTNVKDRIDLVLIALNILKEKNILFKFKIIGCDQEFFIKRFPGLKNEVSSLSERIFFLGKCSHSQVLSELKKSDFSIFVRDVKQSTLAGFPTKFVESISCGVPVITNENINLKKYLVNSYNGFYLDMSSTSSIAFSLEKILQLDSGSILRLKNNVLNSRKFDYTNYIEEFKKIF